MADHDRFDKFLRLNSYAVVFCGLVSLLAAGSIGVLLASAFLIIFLSAWLLENSRWQFSERVGTIIIVFLIPLFYLDWKYSLSGFNTREGLTAGTLARSILILAAVKLLQKKGNRDWIFLYIISFFEILLAAGLSISPLFIGSLIIYLICATCSVMTFEIRKTAGTVQNKSIPEPPTAVNKTPIFKLPVISVIFLLITSIFAVPLFFALPRTGNAGFGQGMEGLSVTGFSDTVHLGDIANVQQNDEIVMRVRIEESDKSKIAQIRWRGVALDTFDNKNWSKSKRTVEPFVKTEQDIYRVDFAQNAGNLVAQTFYLEPLETSALFALAHPVALQGNFSVLNKDGDGSLSAARSISERVSYKVYSDATLPTIERLRKDDGVYPIPAQRYLTLPEIDPRIDALARKVIAESNAKNRYDQAKAIENYLKNSYGYTLDLKAGGEQPVADFLFNVKEGHCEYFATALAIMLRTQGIATRIVNGFQSGEYNSTADVYVVRQREAHSWVEVYFPEENAWIPFDATPSAGQFSVNGKPGILGSLNRYVEALETFWIQYVVAYDNQEQKTLARSLRTNLQSLQANAANSSDALQKRLSNWWKQVRGDEGFAESALAIGYGILYLIGFVLGIVCLIWIYRKLGRLRIWERFLNWLTNKKETSIVEFYERMQKVLASKGLKRDSHQTPLEFAFALNMPEAVSITEKYNRVRFGEKKISSDEAREIESWLKNLSSDKNI